ncbi:MAG: T9SS type A sorting domain-containing protein, partial [Bacteroidetes bacterium]|nr:T9SS type A sorting domain-containing protein [Bacteroidota bacterium]
QHCIHLPTFNAFTIPNHPNYFLGAETGSLCDTVLATNYSNLSFTGSLQVFPNPVLSNSEITFSYPSTGEHSIIVINNMEGKEVVRYQLPQWSSVQHFKLPEFSRGIYLARLMSNHASANVKFFVVPGHE